MNRTVPISTWRSRPWLLGFGPGDKAEFGDRDAARRSLCDLATVVTPFLDGLNAITESAAPLADVIMVFLKVTSGHLVDAA
jgi:hypothetical protein